MSERLVGTAGFSAHPTGEYPTTTALAVRSLGPPSLAGGPLEGLGAWFEARCAHLVARFLDFGARRGTTAGETADEESTAALTRIGVAHGLREAVPGLARRLSSELEVTASTVAMSSNLRGSAAM